MLQEFVSSYSCPSFNLRLVLLVLFILFWYVMANSCATCLPLAPNLNLPRVSWADLVTWQVAISVQVEGEDRGVLWIVLQVCMFSMFCPLVFVLSRMFLSLCGNCRALCWYPCFLCTYCFSCVFSLCPKSGSYMLAVLTEDTCIIWVPLVLVALMSCMLFVLVLLV